jgi:hypothetical protein
VVVELRIPAIQELRGAMALKEQVVLSLILDVD